MAELTLFDGFNSTVFENGSIENGFTYWWASDLVEWLGYSNLKSLQNAINKATTVLTNLQVNTLENIIFQYREDTKCNDYRLSRFACYLVVMNADVKKEEVSIAQAYFVSLAGAVQDYFNESKKIERVNVRGEISVHETSISGTFKQSGGTQYGLFQNAGYRGMYNMNIGKLREVRNIDGKRSPLDFMDSTELAANLFRITQTNERIKNKNIKGQKNLEKAHNEVGKQVRQTMKKISGTVPELLPKKEDIRTVKKELKKTNRELKKIDKKK